MMQPFACSAHCLMPLNVAIKGGRGGNGGEITEMGRIFGINRGGWKRNVTPRCSQRYKGYLILPQSTYSSYGAQECFISKVSLGSIIIRGHTETAEGALCEIEGVIPETKMSPMK